jgi:hypothetical protein
LRIFITGQAGRDVTVVELINSCIGEFPKLSRFSSSPLGDLSHQENLEEIAEGITRSMERTIEYAIDLNEEVSVRTLRYQFIVLSRNN